MLFKIYQYIALSFGALLVMTGIPHSTVLAAMAPPAPLDPQIAHAITEAVRLAIPPKTWWERWQPVFPVFASLVTALVAAGVALRVAALSHRLASRKDHAARVIAAYADLVEGIEEVNDAVSLLHMSVKRPDEVSQADVQRFEVSRAMKKYWLARAKVNLVDHSVECKEQQAAVHKELAKLLNDETGDGSYQIDVSRELDKLVAMVRATYAPK